MSNKILVILGHPRTGSFCGAIADRYTTAAENAGADVRRLNVASMEFDARGDVDYWSGEFDREALEPSIHAAMELIRWSDRICWVYPLWWGFMPALLKGFIDRVLSVPEFGSEYDRYGRPVGLLAPRRSTLIITMDAPLFWERLFKRNRGIGVMRYSILKLCGIRVDRLVQIGGMFGSSETMRQKALNRAAGAGQRDAGE